MASFSRLQNIWKCRSLKEVEVIFWSCNYAQGRDEDLGMNVKLHALIVITCDYEQMFYHEHYGRVGHQELGARGSDLPFRGESKFPSSNFLAHRFRNSHL